jgi:hypothetical protein
MEIFFIIAGVVLLFFGRSLYWFFLGAIGFVAGMKLSAIYLAGLNPLAAFAVAVVAGMIGVVMAVFFQTFSVAMAGFISGAYLTYNIPDIFGFQPLAAYQLAVLVGAVIGTILALIFFDWALIIFSSLIGAVLIVSSVPLVFFTRLVAFVVLASAGVALQAKSIRKAKPPVG